MRNQRLKTDALVVGVGLAGLSAAAELSEAGKHVVLVEKSDSYENSSSNYLAGGFNTISSESKLGTPPDSVDAFVADTMRNGSNLNRESFVRLCGDRFQPDVISWLEEKISIQFDKGLHAEGSDIARVKHISDHTGRSIMEKLYQKVTSHPNVTVLQDHFAFDLITKNWINNIILDKDICQGAYVYDINKKQVRTVEAEAVFIGTGGVGMVFPATSNPETAAGDGIAMAYRSFLPIVMMEQLQFHPTGLATPGNGRKPLCTQALRGAGAFLKLHQDDNNDFVKDLGYETELGSNGPRSIVSRAMELEMGKLGRDFVWLDCSPIPSNRLVKEYSDFYAACQAIEMDPTKEPVPVRPILHYSNGGVLVGQSGETVYSEGRGTERLYFIGECAYTGLHGADRFPSNSGPEAVLTGRRAAWHFLENTHPESTASVPLWNSGDATETKKKTLMDFYITTIQNTMGQLCGIIRDEDSLEDANAVMATLRSQIHGFYRKHLVDDHSLTARNMLDVANVVFESARKRKSSIGCQYREDFPEHNPNHNLWTYVRKGSAKEFLPIPK